MEHVHVKPQMYMGSVSLLSEILQHEELDGKIKVACLGSLLLPETLNQLEEQYLTDKQVKPSSSNVFSYIQDPMKRNIYGMCCFSGRS